MRVTTLDAHVAGAAVRLVTSGLPTLDGTTMAERAASFEQQADDIRQLLCLEPRGHAGVLGVALTEPEREEAEAGMLFFDGGGMRPLSRTGILAATALALDAHLISPREPGRLEIDTAAGPIWSRVSARRADGTVAAVSVEGPTAVVVRGNARVTAGRTVPYDLAWSGSGLLAIVDAEAAGVALTPARALELRRAGLDLIAHIGEQRPPESSKELDGCVFVGASTKAGADLRAALVRADGRVTRAPSGEATAAVCAVLSAMGVLAEGEAGIESLSGEVWAVYVDTAPPENGAPAVRVRIEAPVHRTGSHEFVREADDTLIGAAWI